MKRVEVVTLQYMGWSDDNVADSTPDFIGYALQSNKAVDFQAGLRKGLELAAEWLRSDDFGVWQAKDMPSEPSHWWAEPGFRNGRDIAERLPALADEEVE